MKTFTLKEVSKKINVSPGMLKQWEKDLSDFLDIPRTANGARFYSDVEINLLLEIKQMYSNKFSKEMIRESLKKKTVSQTEVKEDTSNSVDEVKYETSSADQEKPETSDPVLPIVTNPLSPFSKEESAIQNADQFFDAMDTYKQTFLNEVKEEIRSVLRKEVVEEFKKEISKGSYITVKTLSDSIYKSTANTKAEIEQLSESLEEATVRNTERLQYLSDSIAHATHETSEEIFTLSKQLSESTDALSHYVDITNTEISHLSETLERDREQVNKELEKYRHEIRQREVAFQDMLTSFRDVAAAKDKKWWKFWS